MSDPLPLPTALVPVPTANAGPGSPEVTAATIQEPFMTAAANEPRTFLEEFLDSDPDHENISLQNYLGRVAEAGKDRISIIIPTFRQKETLPILLDRLVSVLQSLSRSYEIIIIDDRSNDGTLEFIRSLYATYPIRIFEKEGFHGKSFSIQEGINNAIGSIIAILDPNMPYEPEALVPMLQKLDPYDLIIAKDTFSRFPWYQSIIRKLYNISLGHIFMPVNEDIQPGLKIMKRELLDSFAMKTSWNFDVRLINHARHSGFKVTYHEVDPGQQKKVHENISLHDYGVAVREGFLLKKNAILHFFFPFLFPPGPLEYLSKGFTNVADYLYMSNAESAKKSFTPETVSLVVTGGILLSLFCWITSDLLGLSPLALIMTFISVLYVSIIIFKVQMVRRSKKYPCIVFTREELDAAANDSLPTVTAFVPLYKEAEIIPQITTRLKEMEYPPEKLQIIIILEPDDTETIQAYRNTQLPPNFELLVLPDLQPKTKPKALNVALRKATGDVIVIYDADILPDRNQIKKAALAFKKYPDVTYLHVRLDHYNAEYNWITKLFNIEFSFFYDMFFPGIVSMEVPLPLSGHSTYFLHSAITDVKGWDPYNVTEDCDIGIRLFRKGYRKSMVLDSISWEEATNSIPTWAKQRARWMQGFFQTSIVHLRYPLLLKKELGSWSNFIAFLFLVPGTVFLNVINMIQWVLLILWIITRSTVISSMYPGYTIYFAVTSFVVGNFIFTVLNMLGAYKRQRFHLVKFGLISCFYWIMLGYATIKGQIRLFFKPSQWAKTTHNGVSQNTQ
ncbi:MAG: glycosyl transferase [Candidatus Peribacteria bacterium]|nr:glycosyl transferase [Candidatus Peribacteria bacterium]